MSLFDLLREPLWQRWAIEGLRDRKGRPDKLRLVDPEGVVHRVKSWPRNEDKLIGALLSTAMKRHQTSTERLVERRPDPEELSAMLRVDPANTNLRFLRVIDDLWALGPELVLLIPLLGAVRRRLRGGA